MLNLKKYICFAPGHWGRLQAFSWVDLPEQGGSTHCRWRVLVAGLNALLQVLVQGLQEDQGEKPTSSSGEDGGE